MTRGAVRTSEQTARPFLLLSLTSARYAVHVPAAPEPNGFRRSDRRAIGDRTRSSPSGRGRLGRPYPSRSTRRRRTSSRARARGASSTVPGVATSPVRSGTTADGFAATSFRRSGIGVSATCLEPAFGPRGQARGAGTGGSTVRNALDPTAARNGSLPVARPDRHRPDRRHRLASHLTQARARGDPRRGEGPHRRAACRGSRALGLSTPVCELVSSTPVCELVSCARSASRPSTRMPM
jgi:hypothetical protein